MAITRTPMIDDDGSGTTGTIINNAWKQELYSQIDAHVSKALTWAPVDLSGAGLVFGVSAATYSKSGGQVTIALNLTVPGNASPALFNMGGLPYMSTGWSGLYVCYGVVRVYHISANSNSFLAFNETTLAQLTNADMSGAALVLAGVYNTLL